MNREYLESDRIDLGAASVETKGAMTLTSDDEEGGWKHALGLRDD